MYYVCQVGVGVYLAEADFASKPQKETRILATLASVNPRTTLLAAAIATES